MPMGMHHPTNMIHSINIHDMHQVRRKLNYYPLTSKVSHDSNWCLNIRIQDMTMATKSPQNIEWEVTIEGERRHYAAGSRDVLLIVSSERLQGPDIVPRREVTLSEYDWKIISKLGIPHDLVSSDDDVRIMMARYGMDERYIVVDVLRSTPEKELTKKYVLKRIEGMMNNTDKQGIIVNYFGPGKRITGDWCFQDGYITFRDLVELYCKHFKGRVFTIGSDCSYSGHWVKDLTGYLGENGIRPCGHSAREHGMLIKTYTSCKPREIPYCLLNSVRGHQNDKNTGRMTTRLPSFEVADGQHRHGDDPTEIKCDGTIADACTISPDFTWERWIAQYRITIVRGENDRQPVWFYALLHDDEEKIKEYKRLTTEVNSGRYTINMDNYGQVIKSGWGEEPPNYVKDWMQKNYGTC